MAAAVTPVSTATNSANQTIHDFGNFNMPGAGLCVVVVTFWGANNQTVSGVTIGGSAATIQKSNTSSDHKTVIASLAVVASGNVNVTVTLSGTTGSFASAACSAFLVTGASATQTASVEQSGSGASNPDNMALNTTTSGIEFYSYVSGTNKQPSSTGATIYYTASVNSSWHAHGYRLTTSGQTPHTESWTFSNNNAFRSVAASLPPNSLTYTVNLDTAAFVLAGGDNTFHQQVTAFQLGTGAFVLAGGAVTVPVTRAVPLGTGAFAVTTQPVGLRIEFSYPAPAEGEPRDPPHLMVTRVVLARLSAKPKLE